MPDPANPKLRTPLSPPTKAYERSPFAYAELDVTTNCSFLRGASYPDELVDRANTLGYEALAVTDLNSLAGIVQAYVASQTRGVKLITGARLRFVDAPDLLVWTPDRAGYARLCRLLTVGRRRAEKGECTLSLTDFAEHAEGLFAALVPPDLTQADPSFVVGLLKDALGPRLSIAASCPYDGTDRQWMRQLIGLSQATRVPLVATNHVHYHDPGRRPLQDVLTCIRHGCSLNDAGYRLLPNGERHLKSPEQMHRLFAEHPQAIRRGVEIARQCYFELNELKYEYPHELVPEGKTPDTYLAELTWAGAIERYPHGVPEKVRGQVEHELKLIASVRYAAYFLTVHDLVCFARSKRILCQGRGSAANSAVCYCLGVTSVNPNQIDVLFERFISGARGEPPDIDIDFEHERREEVIQYVYNKYGRDRAGMTATVIKYRGRSAIRDIGKALGLGLSVVEQMAKQLDWWHDGAVAERDVLAAGLDMQDRAIQLLVVLTRQLVGFPRHLSQHVGGMVISHGPLCEMVPIENASMADRTVIEWDKDDIDALQMMKIDILALGMLTCISKCLTLLNGRRADGEPGLELHTIPNEVPAVYEMISEADTVGVFQIESRAQMTMLPRLKPKEFYDLVIEVAIVRPGPIQGDMVHPYLRRREGLEVVTYPSQALKEVLGRTLGVPLFQEQAMKIVMVAADFTAGEADQLRRAMASWRYHGSIEQFHDKIIHGMLNNKYTLEFAERLYQQILGFGGYGFPESHAASFALLVYASAWIKRFHPAVFACGLLNSLPMGFYAPAQLVRDACEHGVELRPVDVNFSHWDSTLEDDVAAGPPVHGKQGWGIGGPAVRLGFGRIKGMRATDADLIAAGRRGGPFATVEQFQHRTGLAADAIRRLADADAFGSVRHSRRVALWHTLALKDAQLPLFGPPAAESGSSVELPLMPLRQEVRTDYATTSLSLKRHPVALVRSELDERGLTPMSELAKRQRGSIKVAGLVLIRQRPGTASGIVFITLEDETGVANLIIRPDLFDRYRAAARHAALLQADGLVERQGKVVHVLVQHLVDLSGMLDGYDFRSRDFH